MKKGGILQASIRHAVDDHVEAVGVAIEAASLTKRFSNVCALREVSIQVPMGQVTALLGPNGAGKSTLMHAATGLCLPDAGAISVLGKRPGHRMTRQRVAVMLQTARIPGMLEVAEAIALVSAYYAQPYSLAETLRLAGLEDKARAKVWSLSPGYRQRTHFALAICGDPDLLLLDEPTAYMDAAGRDLVWDYVSQAKRRRKTTFVTTHTIDEAEALADRVIVLHQGIVAADASLGELRRAFATSCVSFDAEEIPSLLDDLSHVRRDGGRVHIVTAEPVRLIENLSQQRLLLNGLTVERTRLEDIVAHLLAATDVTRALA